jgi:DNA-binding CsgD family transcriptional regulator
MAVITEAVEARNGYRGAVIVGRPGVGKTRLLQEVAAAAETLGSIVRWVIGTVTGSALPMGALAEWGGDVDGNSLNLVRQVIAALTAGIGDAALVIAVDDAHLLDDLSSFVLRQLVISGGATVVATVRAEQKVPDQVTALWKEGHLCRLDLQPLSRPQTDQLLQAALGGSVSADCSQRMWDMSRGNALFLRRLVTQERDAGRLVEVDALWHWSGSLEVGASLIDLVELEIGSGAEPVHEVIDMVAVAEPLERSCLTALAEPALIDEAERRGLITAAGDREANLIRVGHPLFGEVRMARAGQLRLRRLRGRIAQALAANPGTDAVRLGLLWLDSDLPPEAGLLLGAAEQATRRLDLVLAERFAGAAAEAGVLEAQILRAHLLVLLNQGEQAERILTSIDRCALPEISWVNVVLLRAANLLWPLGRPEEAWRVVDEALAGTPSDVLSAHLLAVRAAQLAMAGRPEEVEAVTAGVDRPTLASLPALMALWGLTIAAGDLGDPEAAARYAAEGYERAAAAPEATYQGVGLTEFHVCALALAGCVGDAVAAAERAFTQCADAPGISRSVATAVRGMAGLYAGALPQAVDDLGSAITDFAAYGDTTGVFYRFAIVHTEALARAGRIADALEAQAKMHTSRHPTFVFTQPDALLADAWVAAARGHASHARTLASEAADLARSHRQRSREVLCLQTAVQFDDRRPIIAARLNELAALVGGPRVEVAARYADALARGDGTALMDISADLEALGDPLAAADAAAQASTAFSSQGRRGAALTASNRSRSLVGPRSAVSLATRYAASSSPLTPREREIAILAAEGLSNKQIADTLGSALRTVEGHLYRAFAKLEVSTRAELAAVLASQQRE